MSITTDPVRFVFPGNQPISACSRLTQIAGLAADLVTRLIVWLERARQRRQLLALSERALLDFGASFTDAEKEGGKPFWRS